MILLVDKIEKSFGARTLFSGAVVPNQRRRALRPGGPQPARARPRCSRSSWHRHRRRGHRHVCQRRERGLPGAGKPSSQATKPIIAEVMDAAIEIQNLGHRAEELQLKIAEADGTDPRLRSHAHRIRPGSGPLRASGRLRAGEQRAPDPLRPRLSPRGFRAPLL